MRGISFQYTRPITPADPNRMDIACFIGFVPRRKQGSLLPKEIKDWLQRYSWLERAELNDNALLDVPVPIESWESFDQLFAWQQRLDSIVVISSDAVPETISITEDDQLFKIVVNSKEQELTIAVGDYAPAALATVLDDSLDEVDVSVETLGEEKPEHKDTIASLKRRLVQLRRQYKDTKDPLQT